LFKRRGYDWTERYPLIRKAVAAWPSPGILGHRLCRKFAVKTL
jgi:hypothetical protein